MFDVRFSIDRIAGTLKLILTDTSDYSGVSSVVGFYKVIYPDGIFRENTDVLNPDFTIIDSETEIDLRTSNGKLIFGTYTIIQQSNRNTGYVQEQSVFTFNFSEYTPVIENQSNTLTPIIQFGDNSNTVVDNHTLVSHSYELESDWPLSTGVVGTLNSTDASLQMVDSGNYYEGIYEVNIQVDSEYSTADYTLNYKNQTTTTFDIRKFPSFTEIGELINLVKGRLDDAASKSAYEKLYWQITSLYANILSNIRIGEPINDLVLEMQQVAYQTSLCCNPDDYTYSDQPLTASPLTEFDGFLAVANADGTVQFTSETGNVLRFQGLGSNSITFNPATKTVIIGSSDETLYVRYDTNAQGLDASQRLNARTNIQALSKDTNDSRTGNLTQNGITTINGQLRINQQNAVVIRTLEDGTASSLAVDIQNTSGGGLFLQPRGSLRVRARGDSLTGYTIFECENNNSTRTRVFGVLGTDGYTEIGRSAVPVTTVLLRVFGKVEHADATNPADSATLGQVNSLIAVALEDVIAGESYQGTWDASTNTPTLTSSVGTLGHYYQVSVAGSTNLNGITSWAEGDEAVFNGTVWIKRASFGIKTLNGKSGNIVTLNQDEVPDGTIYKQYSQTEKTKLAGIEELADVTDAVNVGVAVNVVSAKTTPVDADTVPLTDSADSNLLKKLSWANIKATLKTYFDTLYNLYVHPNHSGDVTSVSDGATTIAVNVVDNTKLSDVATSTIKGRATAGTGDPEDLTPTQVRTLLNVADGATANASDASLRDRATHTGEQAISTITGLQTALNVKLESADIANFETTTQLNARDTANRSRANHTGTQLASTISDFDTEVANNSAVTANTAKITNATHTGDVTGATALTIANDVVTNAKLANVPAATIKGRATAATGDPEDLTATQVRTLLNVEDGANNYIHPANHPPSIIAQDSSNRFVTDAEKSTWNSKQDALVSGTNIKTVGGTSILGSGDISLPTGVSWVSVPVNKTATGSAGQFARDANFIYHCYATNLWERTPIDTSNWSNA